MKIFVEEVVSVKIKDSPFNLKDNRNKLKPSEIVETQ